MDQHRDLMRELSARLLALHKLLLDREREAYEQMHGPADAGQMLRLLLHEEQFAWLRPLSKLVAQMDDLVDSDEPISKEDAERTYGEAFRLLGSESTRLPVAHILTRACRGEKAADSRPTCDECHAPPRNAWSRALASAAGSRQVRRGDPDAGL